MIVLSKMIRNEWWRSFTIYQNELSCHFWILIYVRSAEFVETLKGWSQRAHLRHVDALSPGQSKALTGIVKLLSSLDHMVIGGPSMDRCAWRKIRVEIQVPETVSGLWLMIFIPTVAQVHLHCVYGVISRHPLLSLRPVFVGEYGWVVQWQVLRGYPKLKSKYSQIQAISLFPD